MEKIFYAGMPALTENQYGAGKAYQICAGFEQGLYDELCGKLAEEAGVTSVVKEIPDGRGGYNARKEWNPVCVRTEL